jgi:hypothetical protein
MVCGKHIQGKGEAGQMANESCTRTCGICVGPCFVLRYSMCLHYPNLYICTCMYLWYLRPAT